MRRLPRSFAPLLVVFVLALSSLACSAGSLFERPPEPIPPTRTPAPTFTPPDPASQRIVFTPPPQQTPGVIVVPPGVDPRSLIPLPPTATPTLTWTPAPSPTPTATTVVVLPTLTPSDITPQPQEVLVPPPTFVPISPLKTPRATRTASATPLPTNTPQPTDTPTLTPTPFVSVESGLVSLRSGPGVDFPLVAQLGPGIPIAIVGRNPEGDWYQICCVNGNSVWVARTHVDVFNDAANAVLVLSDAPPTPTVTSTPTETPTITPTPTATAYPFQVSEGPQFFPTNNELFTIWASIAAPSPEGEIPLPGYFLKVQFRNRDDRATFDDRPNTKGEQPSSDRFGYNVPPGTASGNRVRYNYKFEFFPPDPKVKDPNTLDTRLNVIDGFWRVYVVDGAGVQVSTAIEFSTLLGNNNREVYIGWTRRP